jgi:hypothetical protein
MLATVRIDAQDSNDRAQKTAKEVIAVLREGNDALVTNLPEIAPGPLLEGEQDKWKAGATVVLEVERLAKKVGLKFDADYHGEGYLELLFQPAAPLA